MSATDHLQRLIVELLGTADFGGHNVKVLGRAEKDLASAVEEALREFQYAVVVRRPVLKGAMRGVPFVFWEGARVAVHCTCIPALSDEGYDVGDLRDAVAACLHWRPRDAEDAAAAELGAMLAHPLELLETDAGQDDRAEEIILTFNVVFEMAQGVES